MEVKINVDDQKFNELFEKELDALSEKDIHNIFEECVKEYLSKDNYKAVEELLVQPKQDYWSPSLPTVFTQKMVEKCDVSKLQDVVDICIKELKTNYETILRNLLSNLLVSGIINNCHFQSSVTEVVNQKIYEVLSNNQN